MKRLYSAIIILTILILVATGWYFFGSKITELFKNNSSQNIKAPENILNEKPRKLTKEEQVSLLKDLAPDNPIDTQEEIDEQVDLLQQLQNPEPESNDLDLLNQLNGSVSEDEQLRQLEQLAQ